jgi:hypothetical protein
VVERLVLLEEARATDAPPPPALSAPGGDGGGGGDDVIAGSVETDKPYEQMAPKTPGETDETNETDETDETDVETKNSAHQTHADQPLTAPSAWSAYDRRTLYDPLNVPYEDDWMSRFSSFHGV